MIHLALAINDTSGTYYKHALVTLASVFSHTREKMRVHVLHDDTLLSNLDVFSALCDRFGHSIASYNMESRDFSQAGSHATRWGKGALFRLCMQDCIPEDKVLYLDCDIIVTTDIAPLYSTELNGAMLAGVADFSAIHLPEVSERVRRLGFAPDLYFNTGVLLVDLAALREKYTDLSARLIALLPTPGFCYPDQDALNSFFGTQPGTVRLVDSRYNVTLHNIDFKQKEFSFYQDKILHFTGKKPWNYFFPAAILYWQYYAVAFPEVDVFKAMQSTQMHEYSYLFAYIMRSSRTLALVRRVHDLSEKGLLLSLKQRLFPTGKKNQSNVLLK